MKRVYFISRPDNSRGITAHDKGKVNSFLIPPGDGDEILKFMGNKTTMYVEGYVSDDLQFIVVKEVEGWTV